MKFIADGMLGKLTRWLRLLGQDVKYSARLCDEDLVELAASENRVLLTRDWGLYQRAKAGGLEASYIDAEKESDRLAFLSRIFAFPLEVDFRTSRCPKCNASLQSMRNEEVVGKVEKQTFENYNEFWCCSSCGQIYWQGAHWDRIHATLRAADELKSCQEAI